MLQNVAASARHQITDVWMLKIEKNACKSLRVVSAKPFSHAGGNGFVRFHINHTNLKDNDAIVCDAPAYMLNLQLYICLQGEQVARSPTAACCRCTMVMGGTMVDLC